MVIGIRVRAAFSSLLLILLAACAAPATDEAPMEGRMVVAFEETVEPDAAAAWAGVLGRWAGAEMRYRRPISRDTHLYSVKITPPQEVATVAERLSAHPQVRFAQPDRRARLP
jgi:hypothetical protein